MGLIGSIVGAAGSAVGGYFAGKAANKGYQQQQDIYNQRLADVKAHRDKMYYQDPTQSAANQAAVTQTREALADAAKQSAATSAVTGGTEESQALMKQQAANAVANMMQQQAVQGEAKKEAIWSDADRQIDAYSQYLAQSKLQQQLGKAQNISNAAGGFANAANQLDLGGKVGKTNMTW